MQISSRFTIALHIFACVDTFRSCRATSDFLAGSIRTNPVVIRKILSQLKAAGLIRVARGTGGIEITRPLEEISFRDVYRAVDPLENGGLFRFHESPNPACPVGRNIHMLLDDRLKAVQDAMENEMKKYTLADLHAGLLDLLAKEDPLPGPPGTEPPAAGEQQGNAKRIEKRRCSSENRHDTGSEA